MENQKNLLSQSLASLSLSSAFKSFAAAKGYSTLHDILQVKVSELLKMPGFTYHNLQELFQYLEKEGLADLLIQE